MKQTIRLFSHFMKRLLAVPLPGTCIACTLPLYSLSGLGVCPTCWPALPRWNGQNPPMPPLPKDVDSFYAPFLYTPPISTALVALKFADQPQLAAPLAQFLQPPNLPENPVFVPVPVHRWRFLARQFNQAALLCKAMAKKYQNTEVQINGLKRVVNTPHQIGKSAKARRRLLAGAFQASPCVQNRHVVLVDDVWTTGSTAAACAKALKKAGALSVHVCTIAYVEL